MRTIVTLVFGLCTSISLFGQRTKGELKITHLVGDYYIFTTYHSFKGNPFPANGMYLVTDKGVVMFDTPWDTTQFQPLLDSIKIKHKKNVVMCLATHSHEDRTGGLEFLKKQGTKTYTSRLTDELCKENKQKRAEFTFDKDTVFMVGQYSFQTYYGGQGHTADNIVIWFEGGKILYGGCLVKSTEAPDLGYMGDANLKEWPTTIRNIKRKFGKPSYIVTGHQDWRSKKSLDHTLDLLGDSEKKNYR